jgi:hypothetical protein
MATRDPDPRKPIPRDARGWRVAPAPDGRGMPDSPAKRAPHRSRGFAIFVVALLALNVGSVPLLGPAGQPRVKVPFSPYFVAQVQAGRVASIASTGDAIQGTFKAPVSFPAGGGKSTTTTLFATEVPTFWNNDQLSALLQAHDVQINAQSTTKTTSLLVSLLLGFGPTLLIVAIIILFMRRAAKAGGGMGGLSAFGRSKARRIDPATIMVTFADVAGIDEAKSELTEIVDFLRDPTRYGRLGGRMPHGVLLSGDHLHRRTRRDRTLAAGIGLARGRQRRARADAQSDPDRARWIRTRRGCDRARRDQPARDPRLRTPTIRKVSIIPRGAALGVTLAAPDDDQVSYTREDLIGKIKVALGGRVAEETVFGTDSPLWPRRCSKTRRSTRTTPTPPPACRADRRTHRSSQPAWPSYPTLQIRKCRARTSRRRKRGCYGLQIAQGASLG